EVTSWTPEVLGSASATAAVPETAEEQVRGAAVAVWEEACAREAELLRRETETRERLVREAYERGFSEGRDEGEIAEGARLRTAIAAAEEALDELRAGEVRWTG